MNIHRSFAFACVEATDRPVVNRQVHMQMHVLSALKQHLAR